MDKTFLLELAKAGVPFLILPDGTVVVNPVQGGTVMPLAGILPTIPVGGK